MIRLIGKKNMNWIKEISDNIKEIKYKKSEVRNFTFLFCGFFVAIISYVYFLKDLFLYPLAILLVIFVVGAIFPKLLFPVYFVWISFSVVLGYFVSKIVLSLLFFLLVVPIGIIMRIVKGDWLNFSPDKNKESYWNKHESDTDKDSLEKLS